MAIEQYHTGVVTADLRATMDELTERMGLGWATIQQQVLKLRGPDGPFEVDLTFVYSTRYPYIEVIQGVPGTVWAPQPEGASAVHHLGCWSDDLVADAAALEAAGSPILTTYESPSGEPAGFTYHRLPSGILFELVDSARKAQFEVWLSGGEFTRGGS